MAARQGSVRRASGFVLVAISDIECGGSAANDGTSSKKLFCGLRALPRDDSEKSASILGPDLADLFPLTPDNGPLAEVRCLCSDKLV